MREEERIRIPRFNAARALDPERDVNVRRRRRRPHVTAADADPGDITNEGHPAGSIEEADVMRGVARRVDHLERPTGRFDLFGGTCRRIARGSAINLERHDI